MSPPIAEPKPQRRSTSKRRSALRFEVLNAFVDVGLIDLTRAEIATWLILYSDARPPHGEARASLDDIARRGGMDRRTATRAVASLKKRKMLLITKRGGLNQGPSSYRVFPFPME